MAGHSNIVRPGRSNGERPDMVDAAGLFHDEITVSTLLNAFSEGLLVVDSKQRIVLSNRRVEELFGYSNDEMAGSFVKDLLPDWPSAVYSRHMQGSTQGSQMLPMGRGQELAGRHKSGTGIPVEIGLSFLDTQAGRFGLTIVTDITLRKQTERALLEQNAALSAFAHTVAHDLQSSIGIVYGMSDYLLTTNTELSAQQLHDDLAVIAQASRKMSNIVSELLLLARLRRTEVVLEPVDMAPVVEAALSRLNATIRQQRAEIVRPQTFPLVMGYGPWLEEVWFNYVSNALKYGGQPPCVTLGSTILDDGFVKFWVQDNGRGLSAKAQAQIFATANHSVGTNGRGHGLGLSIVQQIIEKLGGWVRVESVDGNGSIFSFGLLKA